jgi:hypothetical protein
MAAVYPPLSPDVVYALKPNIKYPGSSAQATAAETNATNRMNDAFSPVTVTVPAGTISGKLAL